MKEIRQCPTSLFNNSTASHEETMGRAMKAEAERDAALARLAELNAQKPCASMPRCALNGAEDCTCGVNGPCEGLTDVYLAAGASPVQPSQAGLNELTKVYASIYASPHHITFTTQGLQQLIAAINAKEQP